MGYVTQIFDGSRLRLWRVPRGHLLLHAKECDDRPRMLQSGETGCEEEENEGEDEPAGFGQISHELTVHSRSCHARDQLWDVHQFN